jgi:hypothetical protein
MPLSLLSSSTSASATAAATDAGIQKARRQLEGEVPFLRMAMGHVRGCLGAEFLILLMVRVLFTASSFLFPGPSAADDNPGNNRCGGRALLPLHCGNPLMGVLLLLPGWNYILGTKQYKQLIQMTSLVLTGMLVALQVSLFFRIVGALGRRIRGTFASCRVGRVRGGG